MEATMKELAKLKEEGKIKHIGVCNFGPEDIRTLLKIGVPIISNQLSYVDPNPPPTHTHTYTPRVLAHPFLLVAASVVGGSAAAAARRNCILMRVLMLFASVCVHILVL